MWYSGYALIVCGVRMPIRSVPWVSAYSLISLVSCVVWVIWIGVVLGVIGFRLFLWAS